MVLLVFGVLLGARPAHALDTGDITIVSIRGEVHVTMLGAERPVHVGSILELPATLRTGRDGAVGLRQGATSVDIGPDTLLEFPALAIAGGPIDRIVQPRGNAFYSVGKRPGRKLRVETPLLVGVVKGTQFNVAVQGDSATFSLFEGLLEIRAADESSVVDIQAGEIASRRGGDANIGVLKMDGKAPLPPRIQPGAANNSPNHPGAGDKPAPVVPRAVLAGDAAQDSLPRLAADLPPEAASAASAPVVGAPVASVPVVIETPVASVPVVVETPTVNVPATVETPAVGVPAAVETPAVNVLAAVETPAVNVPAAVQTPVVSVPAVVEVPAVSVPAGAPTVDLGGSVAVNVPAGNVDVGVSVGGVDLGAGVDLGNGNSQGNPNAGPGNNNGNAGEGNNGNGKGNAGTGALNSSGDIDVDSVLNGLLKKPGKK